MPTDGARRALRLALGVSAAFVLTQAPGWPMAYIMPVVLSILLQAPGSMSFGASVRTLLACGGCLIGGLGLAGVAVHFPLVTLGLVAVLLPWVFVYAARGGNLIIVVAMLLGLMVMPITGLSSLAAAKTAGWHIWLDMAIAMAFSAGMFALVPPPMASAAPVAKARPPVAAVWGPAVSITVIVFPLTAAYLVFGWATILTLVFSAFLALQLSSAAGLKFGLVLIAANGIGAVLAVSAHLLLVAAPHLPLMAGLVVLIAFAAAGNLFSGRPTSGLWGPALNSTLVLLGGSLAPLGADEGVEASERLIQIAAAVLYVAAAYALVDAVRRRRPAMAPA